jgi:hypothetical protein
MGSPFHEELFWREVAKSALDIMCCMADSLIPSVGGFEIVRSFWCGKVNVGEFPGRGEPRGAQPIQAPDHNLQPEHKLVSFGIPEAPAAALSACIRDQLLASAEGLFYSLKCIWRL